MAIADQDNQMIPVWPAVVLAILASAYIAAQMLSDVASLRIVSAWGWNVDAGTLVYPLTFTLRDLVHKVAGKRVARALIFTAAAVNLVMAGLFWVVANLPTDSAVGPQAEFGLVLAPVWRIVFASILAEVVSELIDTEIYAAWVRHWGHDLQWGRVLSSNVVSVPVDSALFVSVAFIGKRSPSVLWQILAVNVVFKGLVTLASLPLIYTVRPSRVVDEPDRTRSAREVT